jgi:hypothetical protein
MTYFDHEAVLARIDVEAESGLRFNNVFALKAHPPTRKQAYACPNPAERIAWIGLDQINTVTGNSYAYRESQVSNVRPILVLDWRREEMEEVAARLHKVYDESRSEWNDKTSVAKCYMALDHFLEQNPKPRMPEPMGFGAKVLASAAPGGKEETYLRIVDEVNGTHMGTTPWTTGNGIFHRWAELHNPQPVKQKGSR